MLHQLSNKINLLNIIKNLKERKSTGDDACAKEKILWLIAFRKKADTFM